MDASRFNAPTGELRPIAAGERDGAFIPDPLPRRWDVPLSLWPLLAHAGEELARLDGIGRTLPDAELLLRPLNNREAIRSSSLEGTFDLRSQQQRRMGAVAGVLPARRGRGVSRRDQPLR